MNARADAGMETRLPAILSSKNKPQTTQKEHGGLIREDSAVPCGIKQGPPQEASPCRVRAGDGWREG